MENVEELLAKLNSDNVEETAASLLEMSKEYPADLAQHVYTSAVISSPEKSKMYSSLCRTMKKMSKGTTIPVGEKSFKTLLLCYMWQTWETLYESGNSTEFTNMMQHLVFAANLHANTMCSSKTVHSYIRNLMKDLNVSTDKLQVLCEFLKMTNSRIKFTSSDRLKLMASHEEGKQIVDECLSSIRVW